VKDDRFGYGFWPYLTPYVLFLFLSELSARLPESSWLAVLALKAALPAALIAFFFWHGMYPELRGFGAYWRGVPADLALGAASGLAWMVPYLVAPAGVANSLGGMELPVLGPVWPDPSDAFDPARAGAQWVGVALSLRFVGYACVTPVFEELFIRSFVMRFAEVFNTRRDFRDIPIAQYSVRSFWAVTVFFTLGHVTWEWWVAIPWVVASSLWFYYRGHLGAVILFHAAANAAILVAAVWMDGPLWFFV
jgi:hypothetical protein